MTVDIYEQPPGREPGGQLLNEVVNTWDTSRVGLFEAADRYSRFPTLANAGRFDENAEEVVAAARQSVECIVDDEELETQAKARMIAALLEEDDSQRVTHLNSLITDKSNPLEYDGCRGEALVETIAAVLREGDHDQIITSIFCGYANNFDTDLQLFAEHMSNSRNRKVMDAVKTVGRHTLDLTKMSAAVAIGVWVARRIDRQ